jgi:hypothetical protein
VTDRLRVLTSRSVFITIKFGGTTVVSGDDVAELLAVRTQVGVCRVVDYARKTECHVGIPSDYHEHIIKELEKIIQTYMHVECKQMDPLKFCELAQSCPCGDGAHCSSRFS